MKRLTSMVVVALVGACGQMYDKPGGQPAGGGGQPGPARGQSGPPGADGDPSWNGGTGTTGGDDGTGPSDPDGEPPDGAGEPPDGAGGGAHPGGGAGAKSGNAWLDAHNAFRAKHCAPPMTWNADAASFAQKWASRCKFEHSSSGKFGENLAMGTSGALDPASTVKFWYDEIAQYKFPNGGFSMATGHFTQVVWVGTTSVGCASAMCDGQELFVCEYAPPGNWQGEYPRNVLPLGCK